MKSLVGLLLLSSAAIAAPPPNADMSLAPWYQSLTSPTTGGSCCAVADCRHYPVQPMGDHYEVLYKGEWLQAPKEIVLNRFDNPTGDFVVCIHESYQETGEVKPQVLCLIRAPGT